jgi:hypothetical protein
MGGFVAGFSSLWIEGKPKDPVIKYSLPPGNCRMDQMMASFSGAYVTFPIPELNLGAEASGGTGIEISTLFAIDFCLN